MCDCGIRPLADKRAFSAVDLDPQTMDMDLQLLVIDYSNAAAGEDLLQAGPQCGLLDEPLLQHELHPAISMALPSHPV